MWERPHQIPSGSLTGAGPTGQVSGQEGPNPRPQSHQRELAAALLL